MSAHLYIRIYCNGLKVRSTGNENWYRKTVLEEELGYNVEKHKSYGIADCTLSSTLSNQKNPDTDGIHYNIMTEMVHKVFHSLLSLVPDHMIQGKKHNVFNFQAMLVKSSNKTKIKTTKDVYDIGFYIEIIHKYPATSKTMDIIALKCKESPKEILAYKEIKYRTIKYRTIDDGIIYNIPVNNYSISTILNEKALEYYNETYKKRKDEIIKRLNMYDGK